MRSFTAKRAALLTLALAFPAMSYALGTGRAAGTPLTPPEHTYDQKTCLSCHTTVSKLHARGAHKDVNCGSCHTAKPEHMKTPSAANRPSTRFDHESCAQCHKDQLHDLMDPKYHYAWAKRGGNAAYSFIRDTEDGWPRSIQYKIPRFHIGVMADFIANRANGRFKYDSKRDQGEPQNHAWDVISDKFPQNGELMKGDVVGIGWRPHKGREGQQDSRCLVCKTTETMLGYQYELTKPNPKGYDFSSPVVPMLKSVKTGFNCNFCHDPHSAEPRIVFSPLIESMAGANGKNNAYQKNLGSKAMTPIEVVDMGVRGYPRKIGILKDYNANFMCGQCHNAADRYLNYHKADGSKVTEEDLKKAGISPYSTQFFANPLESYAFFKRLGWDQGTNKTTGVKYYNGSDHPHVEILTQSKHGKAGVTCADCHFAKKKDGTFEHQPSLPKFKVENTCMRSSCHGPGSKDNWKDPGQALYTIEAIQQEYRIRTMKMEMAAKDAQKMLSAIKDGKLTLPAAEKEKLTVAYEKYLSTRDWYFTDFSSGFHDPEGFETTVTKVVWELRAANQAAQKAIDAQKKQTAKK
jgi:nitrite reductase (cytochrome c-552)